MTQLVLAVATTPSSWKELCRDLVHSVFEMFGGKMSLARGETELTPTIDR